MTYSFLLIAVITPRQVGLTRVAPYVVIELPCWVSFSQQRVVYSALPQSIR